MANIQRHVSNKKEAKNKAEGTFVKGRKERSVKYES